MRFTENNGQTINIEPQFIKIKINALVLEAVQAYLTEHDHDANGSRLRRQTAQFAQSDDDFNMDQWVSGYERSS